jgi:hypothetical protein
LEGEPPSRKEVGQTVNSARRKIARNKLYLAQNHFDPFFVKNMQCLMCANRILPTKSSVKGIVEMFMKETKQDNAHKLHARIKEIYSGIGRVQIQELLNADPEHTAAKPLFSNLPPSRPIQAALPMERNQCDLVDMQKYPEKRDDGLEYKFVLSLIDVFSRFLWLRAIPSKHADVVAEKIYEIYMQFGTPLIFQTDQGSEFKQEVELLHSKLGARVIHGRPRHPQTQGKSERSHGTWKAKVKLDMMNAEKEGKQYSWVDTLPAYERVYNESVHSSLGKSPFEVFFGRKPNRLQQFTTDGSEYETLDMDFDEIDAHEDPELLQKNIQEHFDSIDIVRKKAEDKDKDSSDRQTRRLLKKKPPSIYSKGDRVLIKAKKDSKVLGKLRSKKALSGKVVEDDALHFKYRVLFDDEEQSKWFPVDVITMETRSEEIKKQAEAKDQYAAKKYCKCPNPICALMPAEKCMYTMHYTCCKAQIKPEGACCIQSHNHTSQIWMDYKVNLEKMKQDRVREDEVEKAWCVLGVDSCVDLQRVLLEYYAEEKEKKPL